MAWNPVEELDDRQRRQLQQYAELLLDFNRRINLISREDEDQVFRHHIRHCLFLTHRRFPSNSTVVDWGTGGGLPAIPLAIACPDVHVVAIDAIEKKVRAVRSMSRRLGLSNLSVRQTRAEAYSSQAAYSVSRATVALSELWTWHRRLEAPPRGKSEEGSWQTGLVCLKGGDLDQEIGALPPDVTVDCIPLFGFAEDPFYREKAIVHVRASRTTASRT